MNAIEKIYAFLILYILVAVAGLMTYGIYRTATNKQKEPTRCEYVKPAEQPTIKEIPNKNLTPWGLK